LVPGFVTFLISTNQSVEQTTNRSFDLKRQTIQKQRREAAKALKRQAKAAARGEREPFGNVQIAGDQIDAPIIDSGEFSETDF